ncbi:hypothetical protein KSP40_PGU005066 [Platanthera guangdongensis]|uniref:Uncharacterized protein n=1 Tax=Platanthera guangdongensis TaxID=2320717 RepID=A0ABR2ML71_9ASPA
MASEAELVDRLRDILRSSDLSTTTAAIVRRKLETDLGVDLSEKKAFIREQIDIFLGELNEIDVDGKTEGGDGDEVKPEEEEEGGSGGKEVDEEDKVEEKEGSINAGSGSRKRSSDKPTAEVKKRGGGFTKLCGLSPQLQEFVSVPELARTEVVKRLWAHIRENNLQDPTDKRKIICDERLLNLFKVKKIDMFQMNKALSKHIWTLAPENVLLNVQFYHLEFRRSSLRLCLVSTFSREDFAELAHIQTPVDDVESLTAEGFKQLLARPLQNGLEEGDLRRLVWLREISSRKHKKRGAKQSLIFDLHISRTLLRRSPYTWGGFVVSSIHGSYAEEVQTL